MNNTPLDILGVAEALGLDVPVNHSGRLWTRCPRSERHKNNDTHPSLELNPVKQAAFCNPCNFGGNGFSLIMFAKKCDFDLALSWALERGLTNKHGSTQHVAQAHKSLCKPLTPERWAAALERMNHPEPHRAWLENFRISETAWRGLVGFEGEHSDGQDRQRPAFLYPLFDSNGNLLGPHAVRFLDDKPPKVKTKIAAFVLGGHSLRETAETVLVCAGDKDWLTARTLGFSAVGLLGEGHLPKGTVEALRGRQVVFALDADAAGQRATVKHLRTLVNARAIAWPAAWCENGAKDLTDFVLAGHGRSEIESLIESANRVAVEKSEVLPDDSNRIPVKALQKGQAIRNFALSLAEIIAPRNVWFRRGFGVVTIRNEIVRRDDKARPQIVSLTPTVGRTDAERFCRFYQETEKGQRDSSVSVDTFKTVLDCMEFQDALPPLEALLGAPTPYIKKDGILAFTRAGYDPDAWCYTSNSFELDFMSPTDAADVLMDDLLRDFCFKSDADRANALALLLTPTVRSLVRDLSPGFILKANRPGCGKTLLARLVGIVNDGIPPATCPQVTNDELRKQITALLLGGVRIALFDNWKGRLDSVALEGFLTSPIWSDRILGVSENRCFPNDTLVMITSNGLTSTPDAARRFVWIALEWLEEDITRRQFTHADLTRHALEFRQRYYSALMSMVKTWWDEGRPEAAVSMPTFDRWARAVGGIFEVAGIKGFLENRDEASAELDPEGADMHALVRLWAAKLPDREVVTKDLFAIVIESDLFSWILGGPGNERSQQMRLGRILARYRNRIVGGMTITEPRSGSRPPRYFLRAV